MEVISARGISPALLCACILVLAGCGGGALTWDPPEEPRAVYAPGTSYTVKSGDTLYSISWRNRLDWKDLARWNGLADGGLIYPGQVLRLTPPAGTTSSSAAQRTPSRASNPGTSASPGGSKTPAQASGSSAASRVAAWYWPATGPVVTSFNDKNSLGNGLDIGGRMGDPVRAAAAGRVVYAGSGLMGYGQLIIVKHNDTFLSAYGHNRTLAVKEGDTVKIGQKIAEIGEGPGKKPLLHFEIRVDGKPVDPIRYLPRR
jgi:lipoprotein NlpD